MGSNESLVICCNLIQIICLFEILFVVLSIFVRSDLWDVSRDLEGEISGINVSNFENCLFHGGGRWTRLGSDGVRLAGCVRAQVAAGDP